MSLISRNKPFGKAITPTKFRRLALGSWQAPNDPTLYGMLEVNVEAALKHLEYLRLQTTEKLTITHYLGKVFAHVLKLNPELNCEARFGKFYPRTSIDVSFQIAIEEDPTDLPMPHRHDLSSGLVEHADQKNIIEIAKELNASARRIRKDHDPLFQGIKKLSSLIPGILLNTGVTVLRWLLSTLNIWSPLLGIPKNAFGGIMLTNVGSLGLDFAFPSLFPPAGTSSIIAIGAIYKSPVYTTDEDGQVLSTRLEKHIRLCGAFDHRYIDGMHASRIARDIRRYIEHPELLEPK
ncbi:MAG: 2-oxo acid dehydrogenase subunit E2 [Bdellovibrionales bacterium]|nr:2-oxo acid dehydrogenase subunit E2 [Oligoflexia bacterium]